MSQRLELHQLPLYNTGRMSPQQVIAAFAARRNQFSRIITHIAAEKPKSRPQHHLIVGQRGMGKTMLLARIAAELRTNPELSSCFIPLVFVEEQYAVDRLSKFWLNCLDSLADARELAGDTAGVEDIDATVDRLTAAGLKATKNDQPFADEVYEAFAKLAKAAGQRPVLLVDNLQLVFERLEKDQQHSLRELLMRPGSPILIGASPSPPQDTQDYGAAFYDHFKVHYLRSLDEQEMRELLVHLADASGRNDVRQRVLEHPARLKVLRQLTGGNPRTTLTLFFLYAEDFAPSVFGDLEGLLDRVTPLYKARFEELAVQQQVVASAIANHWDPVTAATLATLTGLPAGTISAQLDRLEKIGFIERTELYGETRTGYQLAERFFNIWFLMRSASRRQRREVEFLTRFLENFYEPEDRSRLARYLMAENRFTPDRYIWSRAVAASLTARHEAEDLTRHAELSALQEEADEARARLREVLDFDSLPPATLAFDDLRKKLMALVPEDVGITPEEFAKVVLGDRKMFMNREREKLALRSGKLMKKMVQSVLKAARKSRAADERRFSRPAVVWFSQRLASGQIRTYDDAEDWNRAIEQAENPKVIELMVHSLPTEFGHALARTAVSRITSTLTPAQNASSDTWRTWGYVLFILGLHEDAEIALRHAFARDPDDAWTWHFLGELLTRTERFAEAEAAYREAINRDPENAWSCDGLGRVLQKLGRDREAEAAYREAIRRQPDHAWALCDLGEFCTTSGRYGEAEAAFREATLREPTSKYGFISLGNLYVDRLDRLGDGAKAYDAALKIDPFDEVTHKRRLSLHRDRMGEGARARPLMDMLLALPMRKRALDFDEALFAAYDSNWGLAREALAKALTGPSPTEEGMRASAVLLHLNYGAELLALLEERGGAVRARPWVEALRAVHIGDRRVLQNIAPEIRSTAEMLYDRIENWLKKLPDKTRRRPLPQATQPRTRQRSKR